MEDWPKLVLYIQSGDNESEEGWRSSSGYLKKRDMKGELRLGITDSLTGVEKAFQGKFLQSTVRRCQAHLARYVLTKTSQKIKQQVAGDLRSIYFLQRECNGDLRRISEK